MILPALCARLLCSSVGRAGRWSFLFICRTRWLRLSISTIMLFALGLAAAGIYLPASCLAVIHSRARDQEAQTAASQPAFDIWYGTEQVFGRPGLAQRWINILGTVANANQVRELRYQVNGRAWQPLALGPDQRRLLAPGDFNVEIDSRLLEQGDNALQIKAIFADGSAHVQWVTIVLAEQQWPLPYQIEWREQAPVQERVQVIDGRWTATPLGVRTMAGQIGYDRLLAVGDAEWVDYELTLSLIVHGVDMGAVGSLISLAPSVATNLRWSGHTDAPIVCDQPRCGWYPTGGSTWYDFGVDEWRLSAEPPKGHSTGWQQPLLLNQSYWLKTRVETTPIGNLYRSKTWPAGSPEPELWSMERLARRENAAYGSLLLVAHHVDVTFGSLSVVPLNRFPAWELFTGGLAFAVQWPKALVGGVALILAWYYRRRSPLLSAAVFAAVGVLLVEALVATVAERYLAHWLHSYQMPTRRITMVVLMVDYLRAVMVAGSWLLVLYALFWGHQERREREARP